MTFLNPLALVALAAAAIPALLHLLERRTPPELEFPPLRYLSDAERRSARRLRLRHLLLLVLRTALIVVVVLAAARPLVPTRGGGAHAPTALVVILDNSPSAGAVGGGRPVLERLRSAARGSVAQATSADRVWLMLADGALRAGSREELLAALDVIVPDRRRLDLAAAVTRAVRLVDAEPLTAREVHVASDLQRTALESETGRVVVTSGVRVLALAPSHAPPNRGVVGVRVREGAATVELGGTPDAGAGAVTVRARGIELGRAMVAPGAAASFTLPAAPPGWWTGEVRLEADELRADDSRPFVWRVAPPARVGASPEAGPFVIAALEVLREGGRVSTGNEVAIGERLGGGAATTILLPPADPALVGQTNRALAARGVSWRFGTVGPPGPLEAASLEIIRGAPVARRLRIEGTGPDADSTAVLASVQGEPWLVREPGTGVIIVGSRLDTVWTDLPTVPGFVPFVDALVNRVARGEAPVADAEGQSGITFDVRGADTLGATVYGPDPRESDLSPASAASVRAALGADVLDAERFAAERFAGTRRADASVLLLALALTLAAVELVVATRTR